MSQPSRSHFGISLDSVGSIASKLRSKAVHRSVLWIWPIAGTILLLLIGWLTLRTIGNAVKSTMANNLVVIRDADVKALKIWLSQRKVDAVYVARDEEVVAATKSLLEVSTGDEFTSFDLLRAPQLQSLRDHLTPLLEANDYFGFAIINAEGLVLAALRDDPVGKQGFPQGSEAIEQVFRTGDPTVTQPFFSTIVLEDEAGTARAGVPTMFAAAPIKVDDEIVAVLGLRIRPEQQFTEILSVARAGDSGETYAFNKQGLLISQSRFDEELKQIGLITDRDDSQSILNLDIRDPQVDMTRGRRPQLRRSEQPLTLMAASATSGETGVNVEGYRDYRGVRVIGAWTWLPEYQFGVATEVDVAEAYRPLYILRRVFWTLFILLAVAAIAIFVFTVIVARANRAARRAAFEAKQLGQYSLDEKLGSGGMGVVYMGHHAMLQRPTAIKLLEPDKTTPATIARFEKEVRTTSQLNHPNTIAVYDFGRTPEGLFYYAMEYLEGIDLQALVERYGRLPAERVIHLLRQTCGSLHEAHESGLIHRDIKPANLYLTRRGGISDFIKVLDFGLVKAVDGQAGNLATAAGQLLGTPAYMAPETVRSASSASVQSDLYSVAAVGYFLLSGQTVFDGESPVEVCMKHLNDDPTPLSELLEESTDDRLEQLIMSGLSKDPRQRPASAAEFGAQLDQCRLAFAWTAERATAWWNAVDHSTQDTLASDPTRPDIQVEATQMMKQGELGKE